ncbi:MAG: hypothetical protein BWX72_01120 [Firmicutes bacterium ADurb.Bin080]|jgi:hypothetical protein|nr:DUF3795 domain-containing protein [Clostridiales bacterium]OQC14970.1 MAG: hypothetical protein BWX72_01120 [Firmicutes bacterium ADurb.Bin080]
MLKEELIAPCGMNCGLCYAYQFREKDLNKQGFHRAYCPGCIPRGKNCVYMGKQCKPLSEGLIRFCYECGDFPCKKLKALDKRYHTKYRMSMIENLLFIREKGVEEFLEQQKIKWKCSKCDEFICCHFGLCLNCDIEKLKSNNKYRWDE